MQTSADRKEENKSETVAAGVSRENRSAAVQLKDNRPQALVQKEQVEALSAKASAKAPVQKKANTTGLPDQLKSGIENLSGHSMDDVKVHYNSAQPAQLNAHAYAQGTDIHVASGQEKHLPHEAWHVVQQKQGRVKPTMQMKSKVNINDDEGLEKEADVMGAQAMQTKSMAPVQKKHIKTTGTGNAPTFQLAAPGPIAHATSSCFAAALINTFAVVQKLKELLLPANVIANANAAALQGLLLRAVNTVDATQPVSLQWMQNIMGSLAANGVIANSDDTEDVNNVMGTVMNLLTGNQPDRLDGGHQLSATVVWPAGLTLNQAYDLQMPIVGGLRSYPHVLHVNRQIGNALPIAQTFTIPGGGGAPPVQYRLRSAIRRTPGPLNSATHFVSTIDRGAGAQEWHSSDDVGPVVAPVPNIAAEDVAGANGVMYVYERADAAPVAQLAPPMVPVGGAGAAQAQFTKTYTDRLRKVAPTTSSSGAKKAKPSDFKSRLSRLKARRMARATKGGMFALGKRREVVTPFGPVGVSKGRGNQPYVTTRLGDYGKARLAGSKYAHLELDPEQITGEFTGESTGAGKTVKVPLVRRKAAMLHGILHEAEERRFPGASKIARAALRNIRAKKKTFKRAFIDKDPDFAMAAVGGAQAYNRALEDKQKLTKDQQALIENMSDSSDDEMEEEEPTQSDETTEDDAMTEDDSTDNS